jgi:hypothetical protein
LRTNFGLIGTITSDVITFDSGRSIKGIGGILYQAAVMCGLREDVFLYTNLGEELAADMEEMTGSWSTLQRDGINRVPGPGNQVHLHYPERGERIETLKSVVPPLNPRQIIEDMDKLKMLVLVVNSGFDIELSDWRKIVHSASCPIWLDIHSLPLSRTLNTPREYLPLPEWREWTEGVSFIQANTIELASMLGHPDKVPARAEMFEFAKMAFELGIKAVFVTLGKDGVLALMKGESKTIAASVAKEVVDTTGCGDVFCIGTVVELAAGKDPLTSAAFGLRLASEAVGVKGIEETFLLARNHQKRR